MNTLSIPVSDSQRAFLEAQAAIQGLGSSVDYVQELITEAQKRKAWAHLEKAIQEGLDSGDPIDTTDAYWDQKKSALRSKDLKAGTP